MRKYFYLAKCLGTKSTIQYLFLYLFRLTDPFSKKLHAIHNDKRWHEKTYKFKKILYEKKSSQKNPAFTKKITAYFKTYGIKADDSWHYIFSYVNEIESEKYISEHLFSIFIEPHYNNFLMSKAYGDKNFYNRFFQEIDHPKTVLRYINGLYYDDKYCEISRSDVLKYLVDYHEILIIKPSINSGSSKNINQFHMNNNQCYIGSENVTLTELEDIYPSGFIIQEKIEQHEMLSKIYPLSVNTLKIMTFRFEGEIHLLSAVIRFGNNGSFVDNMQAGGFSCAINNEGFLNNFGVDYNLNKYTEHPFNNSSFAKLKIPNYSALVEKLRNMHKQLHYFDIISWDIAIGKDGNPILIEYNLKFQSVVLHQLNNGPLFGDLTDKVLNDVFN